MRCWLLLFLLLPAACFHSFRQVDVTEIAADSTTSTFVRSPLRLHLLDGSIVQFRSGATIDSGHVSGKGIRYALTLTDSADVTRVPLDSVLGIEAFQQSTNTGRSVAISVLASVGTTVLVVGGLVAIACAVDPKCFGSCPTVYVNDAESGEVLEAELFSYSIAPLLEGRDVDRLRVRPDSLGHITLDIRNEALETHYINHLELLEIETRAGEQVYPDERGMPIAVSGIHNIEAATDAEGRDLRPVLSAADTLVYASSAGRLHDVSLQQLADTIELTVPNPQKSDTVALIFRMRNSLLTTVLFYDVMLGRAGARGLDWLGGDLQQIGAAAQLGRWYAQRMGMRIQVWDGTAFKAVTRIPDSGPIAWKEVGVALPTANAEHVRVRLTFATDQWRMDAVHAATAMRRPAVTRHDISDVIDRSGTARPDARASMMMPDEDYVTTTAGDAMSVRFDVGRSSTTGSSFLLASQGYYTEWVRPAWIESGRGVVFEASDAMLLEALQRWQRVRPEFERRFFETRIPTR